jgi:Domain of unknown function (DUF4124)
MHPRTKWIVAGAFAALAADAATVYKSVDANGVVHFSDQPSPGAQKIVTSAPNSSDSNAQPRARPTAPPPSGQQPIHYNQVNISAPADGQTFFPDQPVNVSVQTEPPLGPGAQVSWQLNGRELTEWGPTASGGSLANLERGSYTLTCSVTDPVSGESRSSSTVTFNVRLPSLLAPQHKR